MLEIEAKIRVDDLAQVRSRLVELGARQVALLDERDVYFNAPHRDFAVTDEALRVRYMQTGCKVTYKGPKIATYAPKAREELNVSVDSGSTFEDILRHLGFAPVAEVNKRRELFSLPGVSVALDDVARVGTFVEIEASSSLKEEDAVLRIDQVARELRISGEYLKLSYLEMLLARR